MAGWIKLHRKLIDNPIMKHPELLQLFIYCLLKANHEPGKSFWGKDQRTVDRGQFVTGRFELAAALNEKPTTIYKRLQTLRKMDFVNTESNNKNTLVTVVNYDLYQSDEEKNDKKRQLDESQRKPQNSNNKSNNENKCETAENTELYETTNESSDNKSNSKVTTKGQQSDTNKNERMKEDKKKDIGDLISSFTKDEKLIEALHDFVRMRIKIKKPMTERAVSNLLSKLEKMSSDVKTQIEILDQSINKSWSDIYPLKEQKKTGTDPNEWK